MRQYESIWCKLKQLPKKEAEQTGVSVSAPRTLHRRLIKAVKKEKWKDLAFKIEIEPRQAILSHYRAPSGSILTFYLHYSWCEQDF